VPTLRRGVAACTSGRRKRFCSDKCRKALKLKGISGQKSGLKGSPGRVVAKTKRCPEMASQPIELKALFFHEIRNSKNVPPHTYELTDGVQINVPPPCTWSGHRTARALAWASATSPGFPLQRGGVHADPSSYGLTRLVSSGANAGPLDQGPRGSCVYRESTVILGAITPSHATLARTTTPRRQPRRMGELGNFLPTT
jgi:hypothetical protein